MENRKSKNNNYKYLFIYLNFHNCLYNIKDYYFNDNIKYKIALKNSEDEKFNQVYFGKESSCLIDNLKPNKNYKIRICCSYSNIDGEWSEFQEIKTKNNVDSIILNETNRENEFI